MKTVERVAADFRTTLWMLAGFSAFLNLLLLAQPIYMLQVYDRILPSQSINTPLFLLCVCDGSRVSFVIELFDLR
jgi:ABC-type protease/lipase transport system fused ATPase/permease subunit